MMHSVKISKQRYSRFGSDGQAVSRNFSEAKKCSTASEYHRNNQNNQPRNNNNNNDNNNQNKDGETPVYDEGYCSIHFPIPFSDKLRAALRGQLIINNCVALLLLIVILYFAHSIYRFLLGEYGDLISNPRMTLVPFLDAAFSAAACLLHITGWYLMQRSKLNRNCISLIRFGYLRKYIWAIIIFAAMLIVVIIYHMLLIDKSLEHFANRFFDWIQNYHILHTEDDKRKSNIVDSIQTEMQCCGANGFEDWYDKEIWHHRYPICRISSGSSREPIYDHPYIPVSCCNVRSAFACVHYVPNEIFNDRTVTLADLSVQNLSNDDPKSKILTLFRDNHHYRGCAYVFAVEFNRLLTWLMLAWSVILGIELYIAIGMQYFLTSVHVSACLIGNTTGYGIGWLAGPSAELVDIAALLADYAELDRWWAVKAKLKFTGGTFGHNESDGPLQDFDADALRLANKMKIVTTVQGQMVSMIDGQLYGEDCATNGSSGSSCDTSTRSSSRNRIPTTGSPRTSRKRTGARKPVLTAELIRHSQAITHSRVVSRMSRAE